jgi:hypothetical protein
MIVREMPILRLSPDDGAHYWVGYYDKQPWSSDAKAILCHRAPFCDRFPELGEPCEIGVLEDQTFRSLAQSHAWNWQQGAQLRWSLLTGEEALMFNDLDEHGKLVSRWIDLEGNETHRINDGVYVVTPDGRTGLTLSFGRLTRLRAEYGFRAAQDTRETNPAPDDDGIWKIDLQSGERELLISVAQLAQIESGDIDLTSCDAPHQHLNHIMIDPNGSRCCFLHRYERDDGIQHSRLFTIGLDGADPRMLMEGLVSHYDWRDPETIVAWGGKRRLLGAGGSSGKLSPMRMTRKALKPVYYAMGKPRFLMNKVMGDSYLIIPDSPGAQPTVFAKGELICDGHNTYHRGQCPVRWMVTDGYPDQRNRQPLYVWDCKEDQGYEVGRYSTPKSLDGDIRVDLHPRWNRTGDRICIDSAMDGSRAVYSVDTSQITAGDIQ